MNEQHRATIRPVPEGVQRPLWSVIIPTYNCANYLRETLASVLAQDPGPEVMQIEVVDDCSTADDPAAVVAELGKGRVSFYQQPENVGYIRNYETCLQRSRGRWIHILHGDDCVREGFYRQMQQAFENNSELGAAFCRTIKMDEFSRWQEIEPLLEPESGILRNWLERIAVRQLISTVSIVVAREVYEKLGGFDRRFSCWAEDWEMWVRIAANYPVWYEAQPLAIRRRHSVSLSGDSRRTGKNMQDVRKAISIVQQYIPDRTARKLSRTASKNYGIHALSTARKYANSGDIVAALNQIREALRCSLSLTVVLSSFKLMVYLVYVAIALSLQRPAPNPPSQSL
ncbi:glycosyltransferase family 2 protein [Oscillatoriales cyanobacterium LEGE 11467]|uniref:Glycosyltransferase family 2 protein n=1 Tax=Zarconia navalis LEGE 11467 TaxID=1828826 RepID=A0A928VUK5_9CYAN|nr:glycosyltransferase family A protein [Zarconia navalis]MBE9039588.1 glycosyltransferase family 2 protein [Zarconia navalis LEGE 11467]